LFWSWGICIFHQECYISHLHVHTFNQCFFCFPFFIFFWWY
jgi:hypothetical protein